MESCQAVKATTPSRSSRARLGGTGTLGGRTVGATQDDSGDRQRRCVRVRGQPNLELPIDMQGTASGRGRERWHHRYRRPAAWRSRDGRSKRVAIRHFRCTGSRKERYHENSEGRGNLNIPVDVYNNRSRTEEQQGNREAYARRSATLRPNRLELGTTFAAAVANGYVPCRGDGAAIW